MPRDVCRRAARHTRPAVVAALLLACAAGCRHHQPPIQVHGRTLVVENQTSREWRDVTVTVNAYYQGRSESLAPGGRLEAGLSNFMTGFGQRFNPARESVKTVTVHATDASGAPVTLDWAEGK